MPRIIPNQQYEVVIRRPKTEDTVVSVYALLWRKSLFWAAYKSEKIAINSIKRRLKIDPDKANLRVWRELETGSLQLEGWS